MCLERGPCWRVSIQKKEVRVLLRRHSRHPQTAPQPTQRTAAAAGTPKSPRSAHVSTLATMLDEYEWGGDTTSLQEDLERDSDHCGPCPDKTTQWARKSVTFTEKQHSYVVSACRPRTFLTYKGDNAVTPQTPHGTQAACPGSLGRAPGGPEQAHGCTPAAVRQQ